MISAVESVAEFKIKVDSVELPRSVELVGVYINKAVNKLAHARLVFKDGDVASSDFPLSKSNVFIPGKAVEVFAGSADQQTPVFSGIIIKQAISIRGNKSPQLIVECRHKAVNATIIKRSNCLHDVTDAKVITAALKASGLTDREMDIEPTSVVHPEMVQFDCTDWDYVISCAEAAGKIVLTNAEKVVVKTPALTATPTETLTFGATAGATIIELDAEMDSRTQFESVVGRTWSASSQELIEETGVEPTLATLGDLDSATLADANKQKSYLVQHGGALTPAEIKQIADASLLKSRLARIRGRLKCDGNATINPGDMIALRGLGGRFNGKAFVSAVRQDFTLAEGWKTQLQVGHTPDWFINEPAVQSTKAAGMLPGSNGLLTGIVTDNEDPQGEFRVRVRIPVIHGSDDGIWARIALADAGNSRGMFFRPEINDEVVLGFLADDPRQPVILGMLHSTALPSPIAPANDNHQKGYTSREQLKLVFDDDKKEIILEPPNGNTITLSDDTRSMQMKDQHGNKITMNDQGIVIEALQNIELKAGAQLVIAAPNLSMSADGSCELKGSGSATIESGGALTIKGAVVNIN